jgi:hypothetical protein
MADPWFLVIKTPAPSTDVWPMGEEPADGDTEGLALRDARVLAAKALLSVPYEWPEIPGWEVSYSPGTPHPSVLAGATVHDGPPEVP